MVSIVTDSPAAMSALEMRRARAFRSSFCRSGNTVALTGATEGEKRNTVRCASPSRV